MKKKVIVLRGMRGQRIHLMVDRMTMIEETDQGCMISTEHETVPTTNNFDEVISELFPEKKVE